MKDLFSSVQNTGQAYSQAIQTQYDMEKMLSDALKAKFTKDNPLIQEKQTKIQDLLQAPEQAQLEFGQPRTVTIGGGQFPAPGQNPVGEQATVSNVFFSPAEQRALTSQRLAGKLAPITTLDDILLAQTGGVQNIIDAITKAYGAKTERAKAEFDVEKTLAELAIKAKGATGQTAEMRNRAALLSPALSTINNLKSKKFNTGPQHWISKGLIKFGGGTGVEDDIVEVNSQFEILRQVVTRFMQGARMSDKDIEIAGNYIPNITDKPQVVRTKLKVLERMLNDISTGMANPADLETQEGKFELVE